MPATGSVADGDARAARWMERFTGRLSWEGRRILEDVRRVEREARAGTVAIVEAETSLRAALERLPALPAEEGRDVVRAWQLGPHARILSRSAIAEADVELDRFVELGTGDRRIVEMVLGMYEADTVNGALRSWAERKAACEEAERRRAGFRAM